MATLILRNIKGSALTFDELDSNFLALDSDITTINNTLSSGVGLGADSVNSLIDARIDSDAFVDLTTSQTITGAKTFTGSTTVPAITLTTDDNTSSAGPIIDLIRNTALANDGDYLGQLKFKGEDDGGASQVYAKITGKISDATNGTEDGLIEYMVSSNGANLILARMTGNAGGKLIIENGASLEVDGGSITVTNGLTANSLTYPTVDGTGGQFLTTNGAGTLSFATVTSYDSVKVQGQIDSDFGTRTTAELTEQTNLYYTDARARAAISATGDVSYDNSTGVISFTDSAQHTSAQIRAMFSAAGDLSYNSTTGEFSYTDSSPFAVQFAAASIFGLSDVTSGTVVTNLNADKVDGYNGVAVYDRNGTLLN